MPLTNPRVSPPSESTGCERLQALEGPPAALAALVHWATAALVYLLSAEATGGVDSSVEWGSWLAADGVRDERCPTAGPAALKEWAVAPRGQPPAAMRRSPASRKHPQLQRLRYASAALFWQTQCLGTLPAAWCLQASPGQETSTSMGEAQATPLATSPLRPKSTGSSPSNPGTSPVVSSKALVKAQRAHLSLDAFASGSLEDLLGPTTPVDSAQNHLSSRPAQQHLSSSSAFTIKGGALTLRACVRACVCVCVRVCARARARPSLSQTEGALAFGRETETGQAGRLSHHVT